MFKKRYFSYVPIKKTPNVGGTIMEIYEFETITYSSCIIQSRRLGRNSCRNYTQSKILVYRLCYKVLCALVS